ncbi:MAG: hypothetical protein MRQ09_02515 [Candidatus Midichloria sp.]|nr:hypothetical protein [Candidatus Midichloria sp.]
MGKLSSMLFSVGAEPAGVAVSDFINRDGKQDIVSTNQEAATISVLIGNGDGHL